MSYSQEGEDVLLNRIFESKRSGFFVDVGAHHPKRFSNTYFLYRRGWRGINIDALPGAMAAFRLERPKDINLEFGVGTQEGELVFYTFCDTALNTFDRALARQRQMEGAKAVGEVRVPVRTLSTLLDDYLPAEQPIDFLSVDVEGMDLDVLQSSNWQKYRPVIVVVEILECATAEAIDHPVSIFLAEQGYKLVAKTLNTAFYRLKSYISKEAKTLHALRGLSVSA